MSDGTTQGRGISVQHDALGSTLISGDGNNVHIYHYHLERENFLEQNTNLRLKDNPYKGLAAFQETDGDRYFGRETQIAKLWQQIRTLYEHPSKPRFLPIYGPSGCGKSSLVRAGLIPELARKPLQGRSQMRVVVFKPGSYPLESLSLLLARVAENSPSPVKKAQEFEEVLRKHSHQKRYEGLRQIGSALPDIGTSPLIIVIDQFEEIYSLCQSAEDRECFIENLLVAACDSTRHVSIVATLRSDFLSETHSFPELNQAMADVGILIPAMTSDELHDAIVKPAVQAGYVIDAGTVNLLVRETEGRIGALPLLQFALQQIWDGLEAGTAPSETLESIGGVGGALSKEAERIYETLSSDEKVIAQQIFVNLIQLGEGVQDTRRRRQIKDLIPIGNTPIQVNRVLQCFAAPNIRMITLSTLAEGVKTAEVTHESLIGSWEKLQEWLTENRKHIEKIRSLEKIANVWLDSGKDETYLLKGEALKACRNSIENSSSQFCSRDVWEYFSESRVRDLRNRKAQRRISFVGILASSVLAVGSVSLGINNLIERNFQSFFFEIRGPVVAPEDIVILAIDDDSLRQGEHARDDPDLYKHLQPIQSWPWQREAYAVAITQLMEAGAKAVALDILFLQNSAHGQEDDDSFAKVLERYGDQIVLAAEYSETTTPYGIEYAPLLPLEQFEAAGVHIGIINFPLEHNGKIHQLGKTFLTEILDSKAKEDIMSSFMPLSFSQATLEAAKVDLPPPTQENIFFYGPNGTFLHIPFWHVLDSDSWDNTLESGAAFKDKIVVIGATSRTSQDLHPAPFSKSLLYPDPMSGVEIIANSIATLKEDRQLSDLFPSNLAKIVVMSLLLLCLYYIVLFRMKKKKNRLLTLVCTAFSYISFSYILFVYLGLIIPVASPSMGIAALLAIIGVSKART